MDEQDVLAYVRTRDRARSSCRWARRACCGPAPGAHGCAGPGAGGFYVVARSVVARSRAGRGLPARAFPAAGGGFINSAALLRAIAAGQLSAAEACECAIARIEATDARVNAFTDRTLARARAEAVAVDRRRAAGETLPPLAGLPYAVKNLFDIQGLTTPPAWPVPRSPSCEEE